ncbi:unnamed protein product, partial [Didymodactylos carnosus]
MNNRNRDLLNRVAIYECDPNLITFDDTNLPDGVCSQLIGNPFSACISQIGPLWGEGGDVTVEYPTETGYPMGGDYPTKYYLMHVHYYNPNLIQNLTDSSGLRFYLSRQLRQYDIGYLTLGAESSHLGVTLPPNMDQFILDAYCPGIFTK